MASWQAELRTLLRAGGALASLVGAGTVQTVAELASAPVAPHPELLARARVLVPAFDVDLLDVDS